MACAYLLLAGVVIFLLVAASENRAKEVERQRVWNERERVRREQERAAQERERREAWLSSPEGRAEIAREQAAREAAEKFRREAERVAEEASARAVWSAWHTRRSFHDVEGMSGLDFESFLANLLFRIGYTQISLTPRTDQGGDIIAKNTNGESVVIQAKRWKKAVGNKAVQEILGAMLHYGTAKGIVITNSRFTPRAVDLASKDNRISLYDGNWLNDQMRSAFSDQVPDFSWDAYQALLLSNPQAKLIHYVPAVAPRVTPQKYKRKRKWRRRY